MTAISAAPIADVAAPRRRCLLDTGIVLIFQKTGHLDAFTLATQTVDIVLVEEVYDEVAEPRSGKHQEAAKAAKAALDGNVTVVGIPLGSPTAETYSALRGKRQSATADVGESASIAYAVHNRDVAFVTNDRAASFIAVRELRGRTMTFHTLLSVLVDDRAMTRRRAQELADAIPGVKGLSVVRPLWWDDWVLAGL